MTTFAIHKHHLKTGSLASLGLLVATGLVLSVGHVLGAGTASLSFSPGSGSYTNNASFTISVTENSGTEAVDSASVDVIYDTSKLQYVSASNGSAFQLCVPPAVSPGKVSFGCTTTGNSTLSGSQAVGSLTFKVLTGSGSSAISFGSSSSIIRHSDGQNIWNTNTGGGTYSFTTPATPPPSPGPASPPSPAPAPSPVTPKATPSQSGAPANPALLPRYNTLAPSAAVSTSAPNVAVQQANPYAPVPVGQPIQTGNGGQMVAIQVSDSKTGKPLANIKVTLDGRQATSDQTGIASFTNVEPGTHKVKINSGGKNETSSIKVQSGQPTDSVQQFGVSLAASHSSGMFWELGGVGIGLLVLGAVGYLLMKRFTNRQYAPATDTTATAIPVVATPQDSSDETTVIRPTIDKEV